MEFELTLVEFARLRLRLFRSNVFLLHSQVPGGGLMSTSVGFLGSMSVRDKLALVSLIYIDTTFLVDRGRTDTRH